MTVPATSNGGNGNGNGNGLSVADQIRQLTDARKLVLSDVSYYPQVVQGILPLVARGSPLPLRRWGSDFLAEAFATPALASSQKETLSLLVLETLKGVLEREGDAEERAKRRMTKGGAVDGNGTEEDPQVLKSVILAAASIYPLALRWVYVALLVPFAFPRANSVLVAMCPTPLRCLPWDTFAAV